MMSIGAVSSKSGEGWILMSSACVVELIGSGSSLISRTPSPVSMMSIGTAMHRLKQDTN